MNNEQIINIKGKTRCKSNIVIVLLVLFTIIFSLGCDMQRENMSGYIYWGGGINQIYRTNLKTRKTEIIFKSKMESYVTNFILDGTDIIFSDRSSNIRKHNLISNRDTDIAKGYLPLYIKRNNILFYTRRGEGLIQNNLTNGIEKVVLKNLPDYGGIKYRDREINNLCLISDDEIAFNYRIKNTIIIYNFKENSFKDMRLGNYSLEGYCSLNNSLILRMNYSFTYLYNLDDKSFKKLKIRRSKASGNFIYISELNGFFYLKMRFPAFIGQRSDMWFYSFETKKERRIVKLAHLHSLYYSKDDILSEIKGVSRDSEIKRMKEEFVISRFYNFQRKSKRKRQELLLKKVKKRIESEQSTK